MADRSTEDLFVYDHLRLHRPKGSNGKIGYGFNNFDDIMKALHKVRTGLAKLRPISGLPKVVKTNLDEDIWQVDYTIDFIGLHYEFALYWEANRYGINQANVHKRRILLIAKRLAATKVPEPSLVPEHDNEHALEHTSLSIPLKKAFGFRFP